jgi:hypothetical protein
VIRVTAYDARVLWQFGGYEDAWGEFPGARRAMRRLLPGAAVTVSRGTLWLRPLSRALARLAAVTAFVAVAVCAIDRRPRPRLRRLDRAGARTTRGPDVCSIARPVGPVVREAVAVSLS